MLLALFVLIQWITLCGQNLSALDRYTTVKKKCEIKMVKYI